ncbi:MAG: DUF2130 domain-containing protein [Microgenomates group bacterium]
MNNQLKIRCPKCGEYFDPGTAFLDQLKEQILKEVKEEERKRAEEKIKEEYQRLVEQFRKEAEEEKERNRKLLQQLEELSEQVRELRRKSEEKEWELRKKLLEEEEKIKEETRRKVLAEYELQAKEKEEMLKQAQRELAELKAKMEKTSQQLQGEAMELLLEEILRKEFPIDEIEEVKKGQRGADVIQKVKDKKGRDCGIILWESKNAVWSEGWIEKLKDDQRRIKAELAVLVVARPPEWLNNGFQYKDGVWVTNRQMVIPLGWALRFDLVRINNERLMNIGREKKAEILYRYINSSEFRGRIEAIIESFSSLQEEIERERRWFQAKWAREEKQLRKFLDNWAGIYGDLQGIIGKTLPEIKSLKLEPGGE